MCSRLLFCANILQIQSKWQSFARGEDELHLENENKSNFILHFTRFVLSLQPLKPFHAMDKKTLEFVTYCIGKLSLILHLSQQEIYKRLKTSGILYDYIVPSYDVLHSFSSRYLMEDLTDYMKEKGVLQA